jgi:hypothetical protein
MLEFYAKSYVEISHQLGIALAIVGEKKYDQEEVSRIVGKLLEETNRLGLLVTRDHIAEMLLELVKGNRATSRLSADKQDLHVAGQMTHDRLAHHFETIHSTLKSELGSVVCRVIPRERVKYSDPKWLFDTSIQKSFPASWGEFQSAGKCYAYGEIRLVLFTLTAHSNGVLSP